MLPTSILYILIVPKASLVGEILSRVWLWTAAYVQALDPKSEILCRSSVEYTALASAVPRPRQQSGTTRGMVARRGQQEEVWDEGASCFRVLTCRAWWNGSWG